ncbi:MAG: phosphoribosyltransferase family protein [Marinoscillum sp.]
MMSLEQNLILTDHQVRQIIKRIAFEIYENNFDEKNIVIVGIVDQGYYVAEMITQELEKIVEGVKVKLVKLTINKQNPLASDVEFDTELKHLKGKSVVLIDDVLNTGKTMAYCLKALLEVDVKKVQTAVLVNRSHKQYPLLANYMGYELSTTIDDHVQVNLEENKGVYLY